MLLRISRQTIDAVKERVDLASLVAERGIALKRVGRTLFGLCPFHSEKTPSFAVSPERGLFHCFGCGVGGDAIGFLVRYDRVSFPEAVRMLAVRAGVELDEPSGARGADRGLERLRREAAAGGQDLTGRTS